MTKNDFYTDYTIRQLYKDHLRTYVNRVNSVNNRTYSEDPTIYAWDLLNEPRWCALGSLCLSTRRCARDWLVSERSLRRRAAAGAMQMPGRCWGTACKRGMRLCHTM